MVLKNKKILVTGALGFIGYKLCIRLLKEGCVVYGLGRNSPDKELPSNFYFVKSDMSDKELLRKYISEVDLIFHLAGQTSKFRSEKEPLNDFEQNSLNTIRLLDLLKDNPKKIIYPSTIALFDGIYYPNSYIEEEIKPTTFYALSKYVSELYLKMFFQKYKIPFTILRFSYVYGSDNFRGVLYDIIKSFREGTEIKLFMNSKNILDFIYIDDVVDALILAAERGSGEILNIGSGKGVMVSELVNKIASMLGVAEYKINLSEDANKEPIKLVFNSDKAKKVLGWYPKVNLGKGIKHLLGENHD